MNLVLPSIAGGVLSGFAWWLVGAMNKEMRANLGRVTIEKGYAIIKWPVNEAHPNKDFLDSLSVATPEAIDSFIKATKILYHSTLRSHPTYKYLGVKKGYKVENGTVSFDDGTNKWYFEGNDGSLKWLEPTQYLS